MVAGYRVQVGDRWILLKKHLWNDWFNLFRTKILILIFLKISNELFVKWRIFSIFLRNSLGIIFISSHKLPNTPNRKRWHKSFQLLPRQQISKMSTHFLFSKFFILLVIDTNVSFSGKNNLFCDVINAIDISAYKSRKFRSVLF